jgi:ribosome-binding factor A
MRHVPTLEFIHDALPESARHIDDLLARARASDAAVAAAAAGASYAGEPDPYRRPAEEEPLDAAQEPPPGEDGAGTAGP